MSNKSELVAPAIEPAVSPEKRWANELRGKVRQTGNEIRRYKDNPSFNNAVEALIALTETGSGALVDVPTGVDQLGIEGARGAFVSVHNKATEILIQNETARAEFTLPTEPIDNTESWKAQIRIHFSKAGETAKAFQSGKTPSAEEVIELGLHLSAMGGLSIARIPEGQEAQAQAYADRYRTTSQLLVGALKNEVEKRKAVTVEVPVEAPLPTIVLETRKPKGRDRSSLDSRDFFLTMSAMKKTRLGTGIDELPESLISPSSGGARTENKGGRAGQGVEKRFYALLLTPLTPEHELIRISKDKPEQYQKALRVMAERKAAVALLGLAFLDQSDENYQKLMDRLAGNISEDSNILKGEMLTFQNNLWLFAERNEKLSEWARKGTSVVRKLMNQIAAFEIEMAQNFPVSSREIIETFLGVGAALKNTDENPSRILHVENILVEAFRDKEARRKLGLDVLLNE